MANRHNFKRTNLPTQYRAMFSMLFWHYKDT